MPRKTKSIETKSEPPAEAGAPVATKTTGKRQSGRRTTPVKKPQKQSAKKDMARETTRISASLQAGTRASGEPSEDEIRLRAYFISERRRRFALAGDADSDWLEARRQLLSEERR